MVLVELSAEYAHVISGWVRSRAEATTFGGRRVPWPLRGEDVLNMAAEAGRDVYVLLDGRRRPVATGSVLIKAGESARIGRVLVDPQRRREGFGRTIVEALIAHAETQPSVEVIRLGVYQHNTAATGLYEGLGFVATSQRRQTALDGTELVTIQMERPTYLSVQQSLPAVRT